MNYTPVIQYYSCLELFWLSQVNETYIYSLGGTVASALS